MGLFICCTLQHHNHAEPVFDSGGRQHAKQQGFEAAAPIVSICEWLCGSCHQWCNPGAAADRSARIGRRAELNRACGGFEFRAGGGGGSLALAWPESAHQAKGCHGT